MKNDAGKTIYAIFGGGLLIQRYVKNNMPIKYAVIKDYHHPDGEDIDSCDTNSLLWDTSLENLQKNANRWAGKEIELIGDKE